MLRSDYGEYRYAITRLFAAVDPWGLVADGAPEDEYESEISKLLRWRRPVTIADMREVLGEVDQATAQRLVDGVARLRDEFGYTPE